MEVHAPTFENKLNPNTIITIVGFVITLGSLLTAYNNVTYTVEDHSKAIVELRTARDTNVNTHREIGISITNLQYRVNQVETGYKAILDRIDRYLSDNDRSFNDLRRELNSVNTQQEVMKQILSRIEARQSIPPSRRGSLQ